jgi:sulfur relay (sulfurtransferase) DsrC/TusE family protein
VVGFVGHAGSGKDTVASMVAHGAELRGSKVAQVSLATPIKRFIGTVFRASDYSLYGPSHARNSVVMTDEGSADSNGLADRDRRFLTQAPLFIKDVLGIDNAYMALEKQLALRDQYWKTWHSLLNWYEQIDTSATVRRLLQTLGTEWGRSVSETLWLDYMYRVGVNTQPDAVNYILVTDVRFHNEAKYIREHDGVILRVSRGTANQGLAAGSGHASERDQFYDEMAKYVSHEIDNNGTFEQTRAQVNQAMGWTE